MRYGPDYFRNRRTFSFAESAFKAWINQPDKPEEITLKDGEYTVRGEPIKQLEYWGHRHGMQHFE